MRQRVRPREHLRRGNAESPTIRVRKSLRGWCRREGEGVPDMGTGLEVEVLRGACW
jgi:hypothetical protein